MAYYTLLLLWVAVVVFKPLYAVPLRTHGGVIYGEDFLRILDPRARSSTTSATDILQTHENLTSSLQDSELKHSASITSSASVADNQQSSNSSKQKSSALRDQQAESLHHFSRRKSATSSRNNSSTTTPRTKRLQLSTPTNRVLDKHQISDPSRDDANYPYLYDDYDYYYYYYLDDIQLPAKSADIKNNSSHINPTSNHTATSNSTLPKVSGNGNAINDRTSSDNLLSRDVTSKSAKSSSGSSNSTTSILIEASSTFPTPRKERLVSSRQPRVHPKFRYQAQTESATSTLPQSEVSEVKTSKSLTDPEVENKLQHANATVASATRKDNLTLISSESRTELPTVRNSTDNTQSLQTTASPPLQEDALAAPDASFVATSRPSVPVLQDRQQRAKAQRNSSNRFRYTTPSSKLESENKNISVAEELKAENTLQKSLGISSSSSVVVEVRVESPRPEPRRMPITKTPPILQALDSVHAKGTPFPPRTVHTVNPDHHTTSFLLSDPLVVDLVPGPRTSNQQPKRPAHPQNKTSTTTIPSRSVTSTPTPNVPVALPLKQKEEQHPEESIGNTSGKSDGTRLPKITPETETSESLLNKTKSETNVKDNSGLNNITSPVESIATAIQTQSQSVSTSVSRTVVHTAQGISNKNTPKLIAVNSTASLKSPTVTAVQKNMTTVSNETLSSNITTQPRTRSISLQKGIHPLGIQPFGEAPGGLAPFGIAPGGLAPHGRKPTGLHPHGLSPYGYALNSTNSTASVSKGAGLTLVDATVAEGGADANNSVGYVAVEHNISRFRHEEKTPDGFIVGEYGEVDHVTGDVNGVRYIAVDNADPNLIYDSLIKFLNL